MVRGTGWAGQSGIRERVGRCNRAVVRDGVGGAIGAECGESDGLVGAEWDERDGVGGVVGAGCGESDGAVGAECGENDGVGKAIWVWCGESDGMGKAIWVWCGESDGVGRAIWVWCGESDGVDRAVGAGCGEKNSVGGVCPERRDGLGRKGGMGSGANLIIIMNSTRAVAGRLSAKGGREWGGAGTGACAKITKQRP